MNENMKISEFKILEIMPSRNEEEIDHYEKLENIVNEYIKISISFL